MERFLKYLESQDLHRVSLRELLLSDSTTAIMNVAIDPEQLDVTVTSCDAASQLIVVRGAAQGDVKITLAEGARLNLLEVLFGGGESRMMIDQGENSVLRSTVVELEASKADYRVALSGRGADVDVDMLQMVADGDHSVMNIRIEHNTSDCTSRSLSKCVAGGKSTGEFHGMVYVAQDAQRTASEQNSRNVALSSEARIVAEPQLEIYADDVKCTHGATVGQMNKEAILYMRQRGLSEEQARKVQLDGFISDVTGRCAFETLREALSELVTERLHSF